MNYTSHSSYKLISKSLCLRHTGGMKVGLHHAVSFTPTWPALGIYQIRGWASSKRCYGSSNKWKNHNAIAGIFIHRFCNWAIMPPLCCKLILVRTPVSSTTRSCPETKPSSSLSVLLQLLSQHLTTHGCQDFMSCFSSLHYFGNQVCTNSIHSFTWEVYH